MAVACGRTADTDDDGTGTTGTVHNNLWKTNLYDQIDAALAQLLPTGVVTTDFGVSATKKISLNGAPGDTYLIETSGTALDVYVSGGQVARFYDATGASAFYGPVTFSSAAAGGIKLTTLTTYADDTAAGSGGLTAGMLYKTSAGAVMVKL